MAGDALRWRYSLLAALTFCTLILLLSTSVNRFKFSLWSDRSSIDISKQFKYQEPVIAGPPVQVPASAGGNGAGSQEAPGAKTPGLSGPQKPANRIVGMIFAGRKEYVSILDCYLQRNLVRNGGWLDEVMWIMHANRTVDIVYLHDLTDAVPEYTLHEIYADGDDEMKPFEDAYKLCKPETVYVKIDDDVLFFEDNAIHTVVQRKIDNPDLLMVSANVLNQEASSWVTQLHLNASLPYLPEITKPDDFVDDDRRHMVDWRPSTLPHWKGHGTYNFSVSSPAPFKGHRWLPLNGEAGLQTPVDMLASNRSLISLGNNSSEYLPWTVVAQQHYSFLGNLEKGQLLRYKFDLWTYNHESQNINFMAFSGNDVFKNPVQGDDGTWWTQTLPAQLDRRAVADGSALAIHFGTRSQTSFSKGIPGRGLRDTDLLRRYRSYATEFICGKPWGSPMH